MNESQKWLLDELLGEEGTCFEEMTQSNLSLGTKVLYLE
jgi:hypothetical protein